MNAQTMSKRDSAEVRAEQAARLLEDPVLQAAFSTVRTNIINEIENIPWDGRQETEDYALELCRTLGNARKTQRAIISLIQGSKLRLADFRPQPPKEQE